MKQGKKHRMVCDETSILSLEYSTMTNECRIEDNVAKKKTMQT